MSFIMAFIISPVKTYWRRKKLKDSVAQEEQVEENKVKELLEGVTMLKERRASIAKISMTEADKQLTLAQMTGKTTPDGVVTNEDQEALTNAKGEGTSSPDIVVEDGKSGPLGVVRLHDEVSPTNGVDSLGSIGAARLIPMPFSPNDDSRLQVATSPNTATATPGGGFQQSPGTGNAAAGSGAGFQQSPGRSPFSHSAAVGHAPDGVPKSITIHTGERSSMVGATSATVDLDATNPLSADHRVDLGPSFGHGVPSLLQREGGGKILPRAIDRGRSISATMPFGGARSNSAVSNISYGRKSVSRHVRPSLASLAELFNATSPPNMNSTQSAATPSTTLEDQPALGSGSHAENRGHRKRAASFAGTISEDGEMNPSPDVPHASAYTAMEGRADTTPYAASECGPDSAPARKTSLDEEFHTHFTRSSTDLSRMHQLALLKLCSPSSKTRAAEFFHAPNSNKSNVGATPNTVNSAIGNYPMHGQQQTPSNRPRAGSGAAAGTPSDLKHGSLNGHSRRLNSNSLAAVHGGSTGLNQVTIEVLGASPRRVVPAQIDVSLSPRAYEAPINLTPKAARLMERLEMSASAHDARLKPSQSPVSVLDSFVLPPIRYIENRQASSSSMSYGRPPAPSATPLTDSSRTSYPGATPNSMVSPPANSAAQRVSSPPKPAAGQQTQWQDGNATFDLEMQPIKEDSESAKS